MQADVSAEADVVRMVAEVEAGSSTPQPQGRTLTPEEIDALADRLESDYLDTIDSEGEGSGERRGERGPDLAEDARVATLSILGESSEAMTITRSRADVC